MNADALLIHHADSFLTRLFGLLVRPQLLDCEALYLAPCASIHTFFMRYSIDVVFVDRSGCVLKLVSDLKPFRAASCRRAYGAVELAAGGAARHGIGEGGRLDVALTKGERQ
jgi:uncharacterized membrane protein (UPF0127 family)